MPNENRQLFNVGDIVVGGPECNGRYGTTNEGWEGRVVEYFRRITFDDTMSVSGVNRYGDPVQYSVIAKYFRLKESVSKYKPNCGRFANSCIP